MQDLHQLRNLILKAKHAYYYSGEPIMSDAEYDSLEDQLRQLAPEDPVLALVGAPVSGDSMLTKASHSIPMGSQSKVNSEEEFRQWLLKSGGWRVHASLKGDGGSAAAYYRDGLLVQAITRGDGTVGEDITANAMRFKGLPAWVGTAEGGFTGAVRFEVILTVEDWTRLDPSRSKNPRNAGNGIMGRKNGHQSDLLTTYAFDIDEVVGESSKVFRSEAEKAQRLTELGFNVIPHRLCEDADKAVAYFQEIARTRDSLPFWIDGVVIKLDDIARQNELGVISGRPRGQVAWKFDSAGVETVVEGVVISGGHTGALIPTAQLKSVDIGGTTVSSASLANFDEIERLDVAVGDSIWLIKANDIIPKIVRVTERPAHRQPIMRPASCPFCGGEVGRRTTTDGKEGAIVECRNGDCPKKSIGKINRWISSLDILGIGDVVLEALVEHFDMEDAADLYSLKDKAEDMAALVTHKERLLTLGEKRTANILAAIDAKRTLTLSQFLGSLGLEHLGKRRVELMIRSAQGALDTLEDWRSGHLRQTEFAEKAGVPNIGSAIQDAIDAMSPTIDKMLANGVEILPPQEDIHAEADQAERKTVCISGKLPSGKKKADYEAPLKAAGYELVDDVSKGLTYLVLADPDSTSSKAVKARKLGIEIINEEGLESLMPSKASLSPPPSSSKRSDTMTTEQQKRNFEYQDEKSAKFWEVSLDGTAVAVRYGKIGSNGQRQIKEFADASDAAKHTAKLVAEKAGKGYVEQQENRLEDAKDPKVTLTAIDPKNRTERSYDSAMEILKDMPDLDQYDGLMEGIREYLSHHRPFATPRYSIQDRTSEVQRRGNLLGGYPYTSAEYPWPLTDGVGYPMQPVVQIDLKDASKILGLDLGDGILQVWGRVDHDLEQAQFQIKNKYNSQILLRLISYEKLRAPVLSDFPEISPWEDKEVSNYKGDLQLVFPDTPDEMRVGSRIEWIGAGDMWQHPIKLECNEEIDDYYFMERVFDDLQEVIITPKNAPDVYLGGHGGQSGGWDDPSIYDEESPILFRAHLGSGMNLAIMVKIESDEAPVFKWVIRYHY